MKRIQTLGTLLSMFLILGGLGVCEVKESLHDLPLNALQVIGSHNSYKQPFDPPVLDYLLALDSNRFQALDYSHLTLSEQLDLGLRNLEIDVFADSLGGKYARPLLWEQFSGSEVMKPFDPNGKMLSPGFKVFHIQDIDFRSHCFRLDECLKELKNWSLAHPDHLPVFITVNAKDKVLPDSTLVVPESFTPLNFSKLDRSIQSGLTSSLLLRPIDIMAEGKTLEETVLTNGWPKVGDLLGKFIFILDERGAKRENYQKAFSEMEEVTFFLNMEAGNPDAAIMIINDPEKHLERIQQLVKQGYIIRTRADADTREARLNDGSRFEHAKASGAQIITTDYYLPSEHFDSPYRVDFEKKKYVRKNPLWMGLNGSK